MRKSLAPLPFSAALGPSRRTTEGRKQIIPTVDRGQACSAASVEQAGRMIGRAERHLAERDRRDIVSARSQRPRPERDGGMWNGASSGYEGNTPTASEPSWLDPRTDRKTPFTDAELDVLADDFIARMADTQAWRELVADLGAPKAKSVVKQRLAAQWPPRSYKAQRSQLFCLRLSSIAEQRLEPEPAQ